jgi:hypothetical protein
MGKVSFGPKGTGFDRTGVAWITLYSGQLASFDRRKCLFGVGRPPPDSRGLRGVKLVISDAHEGLKAATARVLKSTWQRCRVHFIRNALAHAGKGHGRWCSP